MQKLLPPLLSLILGLGSIAANMTVPIVQWPTGAWRLVGLLPVAVGAALTIVNSWLFAKLDTNIMTFNDPDQLVSSGWPNPAGAADDSHRGTRTRPDLCRAVDFGMRAVSNRTRLGPSD